MHLNTPSPSPAGKRQRGITLIESMVALIVAALGILGILGIQMRTLADTQTSVRRAQAIRLIDDLGERMKVNPNALTILSDYTSGWTATPPTPAAATDCAATACSPAELAAYDVADWKRTVQRSLPLGDANIFLAAGESDSSNRRQLGVMISWRENEPDDASDFGDPIDATRFTDGGTQFQAGGTITCPTNRLCHIQYLPVAARCAPYFSGAVTQYFCPGA